MLRQPAPNGARERRSPTCARESGPDLKRIPALQRKRVPISLDEWAGAEDGGDVPGRADRRLGPGSRAVVPGAGGYLLPGHMLTVPTGVFGPPPGSGNLPDPGHLTQGHRLEARQGRCLESCPNRWRTARTPAGPGPADEVLPVEELCERQQDIGVAVLGGGASVRRDVHARSLAAGPNVAPGSNALRVTAPTGRSRSSSDRRPCRCASGRGSACHRGDRDVARGCAAGALQFPKEARDSRLPRPAIRRSSEKAIIAS